MEPQLSGKKINLLIVGASGFIGSHVFNGGRKKGFNVIGTQFSSTKPELLPFNLLKDNIGEILPNHFMNKQNDVAVICSAISRMNRCFLEPEFTRELNVIKTINLIKSLRECNYRIIFLSTDTVFDGVDGHYKEEDKTNPLNEYGRQKVEVEKFILSTGQVDTIVRLGAAVGCDLNSRHLFSDWYRKIINNEPFEECIRGMLISPTHVKDIANAILIIAAKKLKGIYHIANPECFERAELARLFLKELGRKTTVVEKDLNEFNFYEKRPIKISLDSTKFREETKMKFRSMLTSIHIFRQNIQA